MIISHLNLTLVLLPQRCVLIITVTCTIEIMAKFQSSLDPTSPAVGGYSKYFEHRAFCTTASHNNYNLSILLWAFPHPCDTMATRYNKAVWQKHLLGDVVRPCGAARPNRIVGPYNLNVYIWYHKEAFHNTLALLPYPVRHDCAVRRRRTL